MENYDIYRDIAERTNGDIYIGACVIIGQTLKAAQIAGLREFSPIDFST